MTEVTQRPTCGSTSTKPIVWGYPAARDPMLRPTVAPCIFTVGQHTS